MLSPLAWPADFKEFGSGSELVQNSQVWTEGQLLSLMTRATRSIESRCQRRLAPFTSKVESHRAYGISPDEYGEQGDIAMDLTGALGWSQAASLGVSSMVREFWVDETAPMFAEQWTYNFESVKILRTFGDTQTFTGPDFIVWQGPEKDTGHVRMPIGTYCPIGSTIRITYGGGYDPVPDDLSLACIYQATKLLLIGAEPETRDKMSLAELDNEMTMLLGPYARY